MRLVFSVFFGAAAIETNKDLQAEVALLNAAASSGNTEKKASVIQKGIIWALKEERRSGK